jgi:SAM-dependent methyltransferase
VAAVNIRAVAAWAATSRIGFLARRVFFPGSGTYWERRYARGGTSGPGSAGTAAVWKAQVVNAWVRERAVASVLDFGCGDGRQVELGEYPRYLGLDRSETAIRQCCARFEGDHTKSFLCYNPEAFCDPAGWLRADLALSLEVLFHLVENDAFEGYLRRLFDSAERFVAICSSDQELRQISPHERHRNFTRWVAANRPEWRLDQRVDPPADVDLVSSLYLYVRA